MLYETYGLSIELLIFCGCCLGGRNEGRSFEKGIEDAVVRMQFGHWVPLLVHSEARKPFSLSGTTSTLKNGGLCYLGNSEGLHPLSLLILPLEKHILGAYKE